MGQAYATRDATPLEVELFRLLLSTFRDGTGAERELDGSTRPNWRQIERCVADLLNSETSEDKCIFDVIACDDEDEKTFYGYSVKSKQLPVRAFDKLSSTEGRVYMEMTNSPAKFWAGIREDCGLTESHFGKRKAANQIGASLIKTVKRWHAEGKSAFENTYSQKHKCPAVLDLSKSSYFCLSYSKEKDPCKRRYQVHIFSLDYPENIVWKFNTKKCLRGYDPERPGEALLDWYGMSGGQLKYYPRAVKALYTSPIFQLLKPNRMTARERARTYFPDRFTTEGELIEVSSLEPQSELPPLITIKAAGRRKAATCD